MVNVYVDLLLVLNMMVDFFIIIATMRLTQTQSKLWRVIIASVAGSMFSLYIFLPKQNLLVDMALRIIPSIVVILICCGFKNLKAFLRRCAVFYAVSFLYAGVMLGFWMIKKPGGVIINNGVVYFNFSPLVLIITTVICYIVITLIGFFAKRHNPSAERVKISVEFDGKIVSTMALIDTGNSLCDILTNSPIVVASSSFAESLFGAEVCNSAKKLAVGGENIHKFRLIPYNTVGGDGLLPAIRCESLYLHNGKACEERKKPIVAITGDVLGEDYGAIINPEII